MTPLHPQCAMTAGLLSSLRTIISLTEQDVRNPHGMLARTAAQSRDCVPATAAR